MRGIAGGEPYLLAPAISNSDYIHCRVNRESRTRLVVVPLVSAIIPPPGKTDIRPRRCSVTKRKRRGHATIMHCGISSSPLMPRHKRFEIPAPPPAYLTELTQSSDCVIAQNGSIETRNLLLLTDVDVSCSCCVHMKMSFLNFL